MFSSPDYGLQPSNRQREPEPPSKSSLRTLTVSPHQGPPLNSVQKTQLARPVIIPGVHSTEGLRHLKSSLLVLTGGAPYAVIMLSITSLTFHNM